LKFAAEGADVVVVSRTVENSEKVATEIRALGRKAWAFAVDVSDSASVNTAADKILADCGRVDILVNNAGVTRDGLLMRMSDADWDTVLNTNLKGAFHVTRAFSRALLKQRAGRIINTTSVSGIYGNPGQTNYGAAKAGIASFTVIAALELARYGVTANAVAPVALTRMTEGLGPPPKTEADRDMRSPKWIAPIVTWLASTESKHVTGRVFEASGQILAIAEGWHRGPRHAAVADPTQLGAIVDELLASARVNAGMDGEDRVHHAN
jgi:NAD(P)-dependent dehydrogenase (short-subunit alcohol dehydrogenase family)